MSVMNWLAARAERPPGFHRRRLGWVLIADFSLWSLLLGALVLLALFEDPAFTMADAWPLVVTLIIFALLIAAGVWLVMLGRRAQAKALRPLDSEPD